MSTPLIKPTSIRTSRVEIVNLSSNGRPTADVTNCTNNRNGDEDFRAVDDQKRCENAETRNSAKNFGFRPRRKSISLPTELDTVVNMSEPSEYEPQVCHSYARSLIKFGNPGS